MTNIKQKEVWKIHPEFPFIEASNLGRVRTRDRTVTRSDGRKQFVKGRVLKQRLYKNGYVYVEFRVNGKFVHQLVHRIVATCFIPNPDNLPEVNHIDCDRTNNMMDNLEWCTSEYNNTYREKYGTALNRPVIAINPETCEVLWFKSRREAVRQLDVDRSHVNSVIKGCYNQTSGYWFCNADSTAVEKVRAKFADEVAEKVEKLINRSL